MLSRCFLSFVVGALVLGAQEDGEAFFEKNVRPLLAAKCLGCHSAASKPVMGGLRLDDRAAMLSGGSRGASVVPGNPAESLLLKVMLHTAGPLKMPPGPKMSDAETALMAQWIAMGAPWGRSEAIESSAAKKQHWSLVPPSLPKVPSVKMQGWTKSPLDAFVLAGLEAKGLHPAKQADRRTLIRRVTFDLTGLPPTPEQVAAFLQDEKPDAYARLVERLLASTQYGERWARHWLDVARYADSNGLDENLVYKNAFRYRDYVIAAFNQDKPYNEFVREQLAGDLLPETSDLSKQFERWSATGFLSLGAKMLAEDDPVKMQMDIVDEQVDTTARAFLGMTVGCARCHDHKFDPIPTKDYYALAGIFKSSHTMDNFKVVAKWHEHVLAPAEDRAKLAAHEAKIESKRKEILDLKKVENEKLAAPAMRQMGRYLRAARSYEESLKRVVAPVEVERGAVVRLAGSFEKGNVPKELVPKKPNVPEGQKGPFFAEYVVQAPAAGLYQLDVLNQEKGAGTADLWVNGTWVREGDGPVQNRAASPEAGGWGVLAVMPLRKGANTIRLEHASRFPYFEKLLLVAYREKDYPKTVVQAASEFGVNAGFLAQLLDYFDRSRGAGASVLYAWETLGQAGDWKQWSSPVAQLFAGIPNGNPEAIANHYEKQFQAALDSSADGRSPGLKALHDFLHEKYGPFRAPDNVRRDYSVAGRQALERLEDEAKQLAESVPVYPRAMGVKEAAQVGDIPVHLRGSHWSLGEKVPRGFLSAVETKVRPAIPEGSSGRLALADWITQPDNPLTSRVMVNRLWRWHFGRGIVASVDNFGRLGEAPSNPELLDWLAVKFVQEGWSVKAMHRLMVLSSTYQMSSELNESAAAVDPENILLWRMPRRRLEAEAIRDGIMSVSGGLELTAGGSLLTYKDRQYVANTAKGSNVDYDRAIRSVYVPVLRSSLYDVFAAFDLPDPTMLNGDRDSTVVAPQALFMMNSSVMLKHSLKLAQFLLGQPGMENSDRVRLAYERALARPPSAAEIDDALSFVARMKKEWKEDELKAWQSFAKGLLSANEFVYLN